MISGTDKERGQMINGGNIWKSIEHAKSRQLAERRDTRTGDKRQHM